MVSKGVNIRKLMSVNNMTTAATSAASATSTRSAKPISSNIGSNIGCRYLGKIYIVKEDGCRYWLTRNQTDNTVKFIKEGSVNYIKEGSVNYVNTAGWNAEAIAALAVEQAIASASDWYFIGMFFHKTYMFNLCDANKQPICWHGADSGMSMNFVAGQPVVIVKFHEDEGEVDNNNNNGSITNQLTLYLGTQHQLPFKAYWHRSLDSKTNEVAQQLCNQTVIDNSQPYFDDPIYQTSKPWFGWTRFYSVVFWLLLFLFLIVLLVLLYVAATGLPQQQKLMTEWIDYNR